MKTAISLPDSLFEDAERLATRRGLSRSQLYQEALIEYVQRHDPETVTGAWDELLEQEDGKPDPFGALAAARLLAGVEW